MPIWRKDIELSKYSKYKAKNGLSKNGTSGKHACVAHSLTVTTSSPRRSGRRTEGVQRSEGS